MKSSLANLGGSGVAGASDIGPFGPKTERRVVEIPRNYATHLRSCSTLLGGDWSHPSPASVFAGTL
jgi:hypothetical protein